MFETNILGFAWTTQIWAVQASILNFRGVHHFQYQSGALTQDQL